MVYWIEVTAEDIAMGEPRCPHLCPVARAIERATGYAYEVLSDCVRQAWDTGAWPLPADACRFVRDYDRRLPVRPLRFQLVLGPRHEESLGGLTS